jgi:hypothetical protein
MPTGRRAAACWSTAIRRGSISLWHKLRGTAEPQLRNAVRGGINEILVDAKAAGVEWAFVDTAPNMSGAVTDAISAATLVVIPVRLAVFDLAAVKETIDFARQSKKPFALVINAVPPRRDNTESPFVTAGARGAGRAERAGVGRPDHHRTIYSLSLEYGEGRARIRRRLAGRRRGREPVVRDRAVVKAIHWAYAGAAMHRVAGLGVEQAVLVDNHRPRFRRDATLALAHMGLVRTMGSASHGCRVAQRSLRQSFFS